MVQILVIEDEEAIRANLLDLLEAENFDVLAAANGLVGLEIARTKVPDLIMCDIMMPELDGYDVLTALRQDPLTAAIPFIFLTAKAGKTDLRRGMNLGADDYICKPFTQDDVLAAIASRLSKQTVLHQRSQQEMNELRSNITLAFPHELRTALTGILDSSEYLKRTAKNLNSQEVEEIAELINTSSHRLHRLVKNFLLYSDLQLIATDASRIREIRYQQTPAFSLVVRRAATEVAESCDRLSDLQLNLQDARVQLPSAWLEVIVTELVGNAFKYSAPGTPVQVENQLGSEKLTLAIVDQGRGMIAGQVAKVGAFVQFERKKYEQQGAGLGLSIASLMVQICNGELRIESTSGKKTIVEVIFPYGK